MSLCCVCRSWRKVAYGLSGLWTALSVDMDVIDLEELKILPYLFEQWCARASHHPLNFRFKSDDRRHKQTGEMLNTFITSLSHRLRHLDIDSPNFNWLIQPYFEMYGGVGGSDDKPWSTLQFPKLKSAIIRDAIDVCNERTTPLFPFAPCLERVRLDKVLFPVDSAHWLILPWGQLTHLILVKLLYSHLWHQIFSMCPNLRHGSFNITRGLPVANTERVAFNHLVELTLAFNYPVNPSILSIFDFPALITLKIATDDYYHDKRDYWSDAICHRFCEQVAPLRRLSLHGAWPFALLLEAAPHVVELDLSYHFISRMVPSILHGQGGENSLVPDLKVLVVQLPVQYSELEANQIADMIKSRIVMKSSRQKGNGLEKLVAFLDFDSPAEVAYMDMLRAKLQPFVDGGLLIEFKDMTGPWFGRLDPATTEWHEGMTGIARNGVRHKDL